jgi:hypothetical protein
MALDTRLTPIIDALATYLGRGQLILLVGAGASKWAGLPTWSEAVGVLAQDLAPALRRAVPDAAVRFEPPKPGAPLPVEDFLKIAEVHRHLCGEAKLMHRLRQLFDTSHLEGDALPLHRLIVALSRFAPALYTTNFDDLLERAFAAGGRPCQRVADAGDLQEWGYDRVDGRWMARYPIYKLHGTLDRPDTLVLGESDFHRRSDLAANPIDLRFCSDVVGRVLLLIGYSFSDPNLRWIWTKLRDLAVLPRAYFLELGESSDLDIAHFQKDQVVRVDLKASDLHHPVELTQFLQALLDRCQAGV